MTYHTKDVMTHSFYTGIYWIDIPETAFKFFDLTIKKSNHYHLTVDFKRQYYKKIVFSGKSTELHYDRLNGSVINDIVKKYLEIRKEELNGHFQ